MNSGVPGSSTRDIFLVSPRAFRRFVAGFVGSFVVMILTPDNESLEWLMMFAFLGTVITLPVLVKTGVELLRQRLSPPLAPLRAWSRKHAWPLRVVADKLTGASARALRTTQVTSIIVFIERRGWELLWFGGGPVAFVVATTSATLNNPVLTQIWMLPSLFLFGSVSLASSAGIAQERVSDWAVKRAPRDSQDPGQFWFSFFGLLALGAIACGFLLVAFFAALALAATLDPQKHAGWKNAIPWISGLLFGYGALGAAVLVPFNAMFNWFASRRALQTMRDDALFKLAEAAGWTPKREQPLTDSDDDDDAGYDEGDGDDGMMP